MSVWPWLVVALAGAAGAVCRHLADFAVTERSSGHAPWGVFAVNVSGSLLFGVVAGAVGEALGDGPGLVLAVGFCGAYTTFSTHMIDSVRLALERRVVGALANVLGSLAAGVAAVALGFVVGSWLA